MGEGICCPLRERDREGERERESAKERVRKGGSQLGCEGSGVQSLGLRGASNGRGEIQTGMGGFKRAWGDSNGRGRIQPGVKAFKRAWGFGNLEKFGVMERFGVLERCVWGYNPVYKVTPVILYGVVSTDFTQCAGLWGTCATP